MQDAFKVSVFVRGDFQVTGSESEGAVVVGGAMNVTGNNFQVKIERGSVIPYNTALAVGGNISTGNGTQNPNTQAIRVLEVIDVNKSGTTWSSNDVGYISGTTTSREVVYGSIDVTTENPTKSYNYLYNTPPAAIVCPPRQV